MEALPPPSLVARARSPGSARTCSRAPPTRPDAGRSLYLLYLLVPPIVSFLFIDAVWTGTDRDACRAETAGHPVGACWAFVFDKINYFIYGSYPVAERWRVNIFFVLLAVGVGWLLWLEAPRRDLGAVYFFVVFPILSFLLLDGARPGSASSQVPTSLWGGMLVTLLVATVGIVFSLPFGILLALGRRSKLPIVRLASVIFIEFVRGVPLITVLIMANTMLPLFLPGGMHGRPAAAAARRRRALRLRLHGRGGARRPAGDAEGPVRGRDVARPQLLRR